MSKKPTTEAYIERNELAQLMQLSASRVTQLTGEGVLKKDPNGRYPREATLRDVIEFFRKAADLNVLKKEKLQRQCTLLDLDIQKAHAESVPLEVAKRCIENICLACRGALLAIPTRLAGKMAYLQSEVAVESAIRDEIHAALTELSKADFRLWPKEDL